MFLESSINSTNKIMYLTSSVEAFLAQQQVDSFELIGIRARMKRLADKDGTFSAGKLEEIMGKELAGAYQLACSQNPSTMLAGQALKEKMDIVPHSMRQTLGTYQAPERTFL